MGKLSAKSPAKSHQCKQSLSYKFVGFIHTRNLDLAILPSNVISIEILTSFQIAIAGNSDNMFSCLCKYHFKLCLHRRQNNYYF